MRLDEIKLWVRASSLSHVMTGKFGLSETQSIKLSEYIKRDEDSKVEGSKTKPLTERMREEMLNLIDKRDNPVIGATGESYVRDLIVSEMYEIPKDFSSKYTSHGNHHEAYCIHVLSQLLGCKIEKNTERKHDHELRLTGEIDCQIPQADAVVDIKNPYDTFTFSQNRNDEVDINYWWQAQCYMHLWNRENFYLMYFLNENMYMDDENAYDKFDWLDRMIVKKIERDRTAIERYAERLPALQKLFELKKLEMKESIMKTKGHLIDLQNIIKNSNQS